MLNVSTDVPFFLYPYRRISSSFPSASEATLCSSARRNRGLRVCLSTAATAIYGNYTSLRRAAGAATVHSRYQRGRTAPAPETGPSGAAARQEHGGIYQRRRYSSLPTKRLFGLGLFVSGTYLAQSQRRSMQWPRSRWTCQLCSAAR